MPVLASQCPATCMHLSASAELGAEHSVLSAMKRQPDGKHFNANAGQLESTEVQVLPSARGPNDPHSAPPPRVNLVRTKSGHCGVLSLVSSAASAPGNGKAKLQVKEVTSLELVLAESTKYQTISEGIQQDPSAYMEHGIFNQGRCVSHHCCCAERRCHHAHSAPATTLAAPLPRRSHCRRCALPPLRTRVLARSQVCTFTPHHRIAHIAAHPRPSLILLCTADMRLHAASGLTTRSPSRSITHCGSLRWARPSLRAPTSRPSSQVRAA